MTLNQKLIGTWSLQSCVHKLKSGGNFLPFGETPKGILIYTASNLMSVMISHSNRKNFLIPNLFEGTPEEKISSIETFLSYSGTYTIEGNEVLHHVQISLYPNWVGTIQRRFWKLEKDILQLSTASFVSRGEEQVAELHWKRVS